MDLTAVIGSLGEPSVLQARSRPANHRLIAAIGMLFGQLCGEVIGQAAGRGNASGNRPDLIEALEKTITSDNHKAQAAKLSLAPVVTKGDEYITFLKNTEQEIKKLMKW